MRLVRLFLKAFGPFTDRVLDLSASPGRLHLVYGPNEAGKSSALRAMGDLRFGIPLRSADSFLHPYDRMRIGGAFLDGDGRLLGLMRHKGRGDTLGHCCPDSGEVRPGELVRAEQEAALTAGLSRSEFEALFGLDHARLRQGGRDLIAGRGELGAALFEASAGTQGVAALLESLEAEAKKFYSPRATTATINEARRQIEDARQAGRAALTKPAQWKQLQHAHEQSREALEQAEQELQRLRTRLGDLGELRTVAPLLRQQALLEAEAAEMSDAPDLPPQSAEQRLLAEDALARAQADALRAEKDLQAAQATLDALVVEERVLELAPLIERLLAAREQVEQARAERQQLQASLAHAQDEFALCATRIAPDAPSRQLLAAVPSRADEAALRHRLDTLTQLDTKAQLMREQQGRLEEELGAVEDALPALPDPRDRSRLPEALAAARGLGDLPARLGGLRQRREQLAARLQDALHALGLPDAQALQRLQTLLPAQIDEAGRAFEELAQARRLLEDERGKLLAEQAAQQLRLHTLQAAGELATAASLREARRRRDEGWRLLKQACLEPAVREAAAPVLPAGAHSPASAFEALMVEADRQADLLHRDADRAAKVEECAARIEQAHGRLAEINARLAALGQQEQDQRSHWQQRLAERGLPPLGAEALRQWQARGEAARELALQWREAQQAEADLHAQGGQVQDALRAALGRDADGLPQDQEDAWHPLLGRAQHSERAMREAQAHRGASEAARERLCRERRAIETALADIEAQRHRELDALAAWHGRLLLPAGSSAAAVQARVQELLALSALHQESASWRLRLGVLEAQAQAVSQDAADLARLLGEAAPAHVGGFADRLASRLQDSRAAERRRMLCLKDREGAQAALSRATEAAQRQEAALAALCREAGGVGRGELAGVQTRATRKAQVRTALQQLRQQIAQASRHPLEELARRLEGQDTSALELQRQQCEEAIRLKEAELKAAREREHQARAALEAIDTSDEAAAQREALEQAAARLRAAVPPWARLKLASVLLQEALRRFRERAQGPMLAEASRYFIQMTAGRYTRLLIDEREQGPTLLAEREDGRHVTLDALSEGTADQLYLALRLAAQAVQWRSGSPRSRFEMPLVLDDVLMTSDDERAQHILRALHLFSAHSQVLLFTHHRHLHELAAATFSPDEIGLHRL